MTINRRLVAELRAVLDGRPTTIVGAAPIPIAPIVLPRAVIAVNGGISSVTGDVDVWVVNARETDPPEWGIERRRMHALMFKQGKGRVVALAVLLTKSTDAGPATQRRLRRQQTHVGLAIEVNQIDRHAIETAAGARTADLAKHALSAGLFAACFACLADVPEVRLEGFSWAGGYAYLPGSTHVRGHSYGDKLAIARLEARYGDRLIHALPRKDRGPMAKRQAPTSHTQPAVVAPPPDAEAIPIPAPPASERTRSAPTRVTATRMGFYGNQRRRPGDVFDLRDPSHFSDKWMEPADPTAAPHATTRDEAIRAEHRMIARGQSPTLKANAADLEETPTPASGEDVL